ncbi:RNA 3'-terminal phosphate cyclase [archaeon HR01]|nr:RNA 3'-terminal phosphate cyclase [archaeon HR01]
MIELDGSIGEGGGQVLRVSIALSAILSKPIHIYNIRKKRSNPGLRPQHISAVKSVAEACNGSVQGLHVGSTEIIFTPGYLEGGELRIDTGTAGSITLVLQSLLPVLSFSSKPSSFHLIGGTNNPMAPPVEYLEKVLLPLLSKMGVRCGIELVRRGFYPRGGGVVRGWVEPVHSLSPLEEVERRDIGRVYGLSYTCRLPSHVSERMASSAEKSLSNKGFVASIEREALMPNHPKCSTDPGAGIILVADGAYLGADRLGAPGLPAEEVGAGAAKQLIEEIESNAAIDRHAADMLVIWVSLAEGRSRYSVSTLTSHTLTSVEICRLLTGAEIELAGRLGGPGIITCRGIGFKRF